MGEETPLGQALDDDGCSRLLVVGTLDDLHAPFLPFLFLKEITCFMCGSKGER